MANKKRNKEINSRKKTQGPLAHCVIATGGPKMPPEFLLHYVPLCATFDRPPAMTAPTPLRVDEGGS